MANPLLILGDRMLGLCLASPGALRASSAESKVLHPTAAADADSSPAKQLVWWLHIPKCGTSFASSAHMYVEDPSHKHACCGPNHKRLPADVPDSSLANVLAMFREPKQRAASAFYYLNHMSTPKKDKCCTGDWGWSKKTYKPIRSHIRQGASFNATLSSFVGCQTNMVLGYGCMAMPDYGEKHNSNRHVAKRAIKRMEKFKFVGLESEWLVSICLFNFKMTGNRFVTSSQVGFLKPGKGKHKDGKTQSYTKYDVTGYPDDPLDDVLYAAVEKRFQEEVSAHDVSEETCPFVESDVAQRRWNLRVRTPDRPALDADSWAGAEDAWVDAEAVRKFGIKLETPPLDREPEQLASPSQGH